MRKEVTLRILKDEAPELVPENYREINGFVAEATVSYDDARRIFQRAALRKSLGARYFGVTWFIVRNKFNEEEISAASHFHAWVDRAHHHLVPRDENALSDCPVCGLPMSMELCPVVSSYKLASPLVVATNGVWLAKPTLAAGLAEKDWQGFVLSPAFTSKAKRRDYLERHGLSHVATIVPIGDEIASGLESLLLTKRASADEADWWVVAPTRVRAKISSEMVVGRDPGLSSNIQRTTGSAEPKEAATACERYSEKYPSSCGHLLGERQLGPLILEECEELDGDMILTQSTTGQKKQGLFRPQRERIVSRRLMAMLLEHGVTSVDFQPIQCAS